MAPPPAVTATATTVTTTPGFSETFDAATQKTTFRFNGTVWPCARNATELAGYGAADLFTQEPLGFYVPPETGLCPPNTFCFVDAPWLDPPSQCACSLNYLRYGWACSETKPFGKAVAAVNAFVLVVSAACGLVCAINLLAVAAGTRAATVPGGSSRTEQCRVAMSKATTLSMAWGFGWALGDVILQSCYIVYHLDDGSSANHYSPKGSAAFTIGASITMVCVSMTFVTIALAWLETADKVARLSPSTRTLMGRFRVAIALWSAVLVAIVVGLTMAGLNRFILLMSVILLVIYTFGYVIAFARIRVAMGASAKSSPQPSSSSRADADADAAHPSDIAIAMRRVYRSIATNALCVAISTAIAVSFGFAVSAPWSLKGPLDKNPAMALQTMFFVFLALDEVIFVAFLDRVVAQAVVSRVRWLIGSSSRRRPSGATSMRGGGGGGGGGGAGPGTTDLTVTGRVATVATVP